MVIEPPSAVVMVRPHGFRVNDATAADNAFQVAGEADAKAAYDEVTAAIARLREAGVTVHLFEDDSGATPDSVFPNNWFTTHEDGRILTYPMRAANRRGERRRDILAALAQDYRVDAVVNLHEYEQQGRFLEGTGSMVFDRHARIAYAALSPRTDPEVLAHACGEIDYMPLLFEAANAEGTPVYHTNVIMTLGTGYGLVALDMIGAGRDEVEASLGESGRTMIAIDEAQVGEFAGNAFELQGRDGRILALSARAHAALRPDQLAIIEAHARLLPLPVPTIERSGGSVRCMLAGIHLPPR